MYPFSTEEEAHRIIASMAELGLFSHAPADIQGGNVFDTLCHHLARLLSFKPGERDLVMLQHKFVVEWRDGSKVSQSRPVPAQARQSKRSHPWCPDRFRFSKIEYADAGGPL